MCICLFVCIIRERLEFVYMFYFNFLTFDFERWIVFQKKVVEFFVNLLFLLAIVFIYERNKFNLLNFCIFRFQNFNFQRESLDK